MAHTDPPEAALLDDNRYHHGDLRRALINAALDLLTEEQNWEFSLREVARRAKVSHTAPYNHFDSKQNLLVAVAASGYDLLRARMQDSAAQAANPASALQAIGAAYVRFGVENPAHYRLMFGAALSADKNGLPPALDISAAAAKKLLSDVIRAGTEQGVFTVALQPASTAELDTATLSAWSLVHGLTMLLIDGLASADSAEPVTASSAEQIASRVTQILLSGISLKSNG